MGGGGGGGGGAGGGGRGVVVRFEQKHCFHFESRLQNLMTPMLLYLFHDRPWGSYDASYGRHSNHTQFSSAMRLWRARRSG